MAKARRHQAPPPPLYLHEALEQLKPREPLVEVKDHALDLSLLVGSFGVPEVKLERRALEGAAVESGRFRYAERAQPHELRLSVRSLHIQRSRVLRLPDLLRAEVLALGAARSSLVLDSRARYGGCWDLGVNRRRVLRWMRGLERALDRDGTPAPRNGGRAALD